MRNQRAITAADVPIIFNTATMQSLARVAQLPDGSDLVRFGESVRDAARIYARDAAVPSSNEQRQEIKCLYRLAERQDFAGLARAIENITPAVRDALERRRTNVATRDPRLCIPVSTDLSNPDKRESGAAGLKALIQVGGAWVEGRTRPNGHRSRSWRPVLVAPKPSRGEPRREAERSLVGWLQTAVLEAGGNVPSTAHHEKPGPFARFVAAVLRLVGATGPGNASGLAVQLISDTHKRVRDRKKEVAYDLDP